MDLIRLDSRHVSCVRDRGRRSRRSAGVGASASDVAGKACGRARAMPIAHRERSRGLGGPQPPQARAQSASGAMVRLSEGVVVGSNPTRPTSKRLRPVAQW